MPLTGVNDTTGLGGYFMSRATNRFLPFLSLFLLSTSDVAADDGWQLRDAHMGRGKHHFSEFCTEVGKGQALQVEFETPHRVDFNIHYHTDTETLFPVRELVEGEAAFEITANEGGEYCLMFTNTERRPETLLIRTRYRVR